MIQAVNKKIIKKKNIKTLFASQHFDARAMYI
jgi:hypothetical protein